MPVAILEAVMLAFAISVDAFIASFSYGSNKIKIPPLSVFIITSLSSAILGLSLITGALVRAYIPGGITTAICFIILFILGLTKLLDSFAKAIIRKHSNINREIKFSMFSFKFILTLYADPIEADIDDSKLISPAEAASLAVALSLDGLAVGFGAAVGHVNGLAVFLASLVIGALAIMLGCYTGNKAARTLRFNLSWLSGALLILLAVVKLF